MKEIRLYGIWGAWYFLCVVLGAVSDPTGAEKALLVVCALLFFLPGFALLYQAKKTKNPKALLRIRIISMCSLGLTLIFMIANFASVLASELVGTVLYALLILVSAPMICGQYWLISLFLWACLLIGSFSGKKKIQN